ncbi:MAG: DUF485 domain-containing protein [Magnetococcales bacterium]|nr:DUF485 domain-containing protein [Magnetococcales bacterium]NGZ26005.1 DUF485 domain-containing protein [Magnetococcales bacterium]
MDSNLNKRISDHPKYKELLVKRSSFAWLLSIVVLVIYYSFILVVAFAPKFLGTKIAEGSIISVGVPIGISVIVSAFALTGVYVRRANSEFDDLVNQIKEDVK